MPSTLGNQEVEQQSNSIYCTTDSQFTVNSFEFEVGQIFAAVITNVLRPDMIHMQQMRISSPVDLSQEGINRRFDTFIEMLSKMRDNVDSFPPLIVPEVGMPACGMYTVDNWWYRCEITDILDEGCCVKYVDYGNSEVLPLWRLRALPIEYLSCETLALRCKIYGIFPVKDNWDDSDITLMAKLFDRDAPFWVRVEGVYPAEVSIYSSNPCEDYHAEPIYKKYADQEIVLWLDSYIDYAR